MKLPVDVSSRRDAELEVARYCSTDRQEKKTYNAELREWYTRGSIDGGRALENMLQSHVRQSSAYLFQSESVRFGAILPPRYGDQFNQKLEAYRDEVHRWFHDSRGGLRVSLGVKMAHIYPSVVFKVTPSAGGPYVSLVPDPADVGVLEPDRPFDRQEAKLHFFWMTLSRFRRFVEDHPNADALVRLAARESETGSGDDFAGAVAERIVFDNVGSPIEGGGTPVAGTMLPEARVEVPRVCLAELWLVDDRVRDWRIVTFLAPNGEPSVSIWSRKNTVVPGLDPFVALTLEEIPNYTWGLSILDDLTPLQQERDEYRQKIMRLFDLQLDPPLVLGGFGGLKDDKAQRLRKPGGVLSTSLPNPAVHRLAPTMPPEAFGVLGENARAFAQAGGLPLLFQGQGDSGGGLRAGDQVGVLATLASARIRQAAMTVEYAVSEIATLGALILRELQPDDAPLMLPSGERFHMKQIPREVVFTVSSHSASPLYAEAVGATADSLLKAGAISRPTYVELKRPPMVDVLKAEARRLDEAAAKRQQRILEIAEMKASRGRSR